MRRQFAAFQQQLVRGLPRSWKGWPRLQVSAPAKHHVAGVDGHSVDDGVGELAASKYGLEIVRSPETPGGARGCLDDMSGCGRQVWPVGRLRQGSSRGNGRPASETGDWHESDSG